MIAQINEIAQIWWQWMAGMFWQVSLFIIIITLLDMAIRRWAWPQVRYVLWGLVFIKLIIPPTWQMPTSIVSWIQPKVEEQISIQIAPIEVSADYQEISASSLSSSTQISESAVKTEKPSWQAIVLLTWFAGMIAFSLILIIKLSRLPRRSKKRDDQTVPEWFQGLLSKTAQGLKLRKTPTVIFSNDAKSPAVYGIFKPVILLPEGCLDHLSKEQAEHVLMHELCHLKRGDLLVHWFCLMLQVIYWFNPLLIWTRRQMRHVCEICCDLSVANLLREKTTAYRNTLLATAKELLTERVEPGLGLLGVFEEPFKLVTRIRWLEKRTWENRKKKIVATIITCLIMVVCVMPMSGISKTAHQYMAITIQLDSIPIEFKKNVEAQADVAESDNKSSSLTLVGNTRLDMGSMIVNADSMTIFHNKDKDIVNEPDAFSIKSINATGNVKIELEDIILTSGNAVYDSEAEMVVLTDDPIFYKGTEIIIGDAIRINVATGLITVEIPDGIKTLEGHNYNVISSEKVQDGSNTAMPLLIGLDAVVMEVDAYKDLDLDSEWIISPEDQSTEENSFRKLYMSVTTPTAEDPTVKIGPDGVESVPGISDSQAAAIPPVEATGIEYDGEYQGIAMRAAFSTSMKDGVLTSDEEAMQTKYLLSSFSMGFFEDDISIQGRFFPDIASLINSMETEPGVSILGTPQIVTHDNGKTVTSLPMALDKHSTVTLKSTPKIMEEGIVYQQIELRISPSIEEMSKGIGSSSISVPVIVEEGGTMVLICSFKDTTAQQDSLAGKKLYVFLTPHVFNTPEEAREAF